MTGELLATLPLKDISYAGIVVFIIILILTDRLVTRRRLLDEREEKMFYRNAVENLQTSFDKLSDSVTRQVTLAEATNHALTEIQALASRVHGQEAGPR